MSFKLILISPLIILLVICLSRALFLYHPAEAPKSCIDSSNHQRINLTQSILNRFKGSLNIKTISYGLKNYENEQLEKLANFIEVSFPAIHKSKFITREFVSNYTLLYSIRGSNEKLRPYLLTSHLDVVPAVREKWSSDPFEAVVKDDGYIYGRGTIDAKHLLMSMLEAFEFMLEKGFKPKRSFFLVFGHDEEIGGLEGAQNVSKILTDRLRESKWDKLEYILDEGNIISTTPVPGVQAKVALVGVVEKGYATVKLSTFGPVGHASIPPEYTAITQLARVLSRFHSNMLPCFLGYGVEREMIDIFALHASWPYKFVYSNFWLFQPILKVAFQRDPSLNSLIRTSTAVTVIHAGTKENVLPDSAIAYVNHRIHPSQSVDDIVDFDRRIVNNPKVRVELSGFYTNPTPIAPYGEDSSAFQLIKQSVLQIYPGTVVVPSVFLAASDSRWYVNLTDSIYKFSAIAVSLDEMTRFHGHDERISLENYENLLNFFHHLIENSDKENYDFTGKQKRVEL